MHECEYVFIATGMADMAQELYKQLEPHIQRAKAAGQTICFGGHSLGGALATLVCCLAMLQLRLAPGLVQCVTFGSPPVLAHSDGKDGNAILQVRCKGCPDSWRLYPAAPGGMLVLHCIDALAGSAVILHHFVESTSLKRCRYTVCQFVCGDALVVLNVNTPCRLSLQMLGLPSAGMRSFVLDSDPIPRAMLSIDPTFSFFKQWPAVKGLLQLRQWFVRQTSAPVVNPARFLYVNVGQVYLIKWTVDQGHKVSIAWVN